MFFSKTKWWLSAPLEKKWTDIMGKYCRFVARHPWPFIIVPILTTIALSMGIVLNFHIVRGVHWLYAPLDARWKSEEAVFQDNWASDDEHFYPGKDVLRRKGLYLVVESVDDGDVLRREEAREFLLLMHWVTNNTFLSENGTRFSYRDICLHFQNECFSNTHARLLGDIYAKGDQDLFNVTFPLFFSRFATEPIDISSTLGGVKVDGRGHVRSAKAWMLLFQLKQHNPDVLKLSSEFEVLIEKAVKEGTLPTDRLRVSYFHSNTFETELAESNMRLVPKFAITFSILIVFSVLCTFNTQWCDWNRRIMPIVDWVLSKPVMGVVGVLTTAMAILSAMGALLLIGVTFVDMCTVMPFLSLTVGIDDTFLMLASWHETSRTLSVEDRIEKSMKHAAVSISITSLTDAIAFLVGAIAPLPAVMYFCYYSSAAICFIFLYSVTIFVGILSLQGRLEEEGRHNITMKETKCISKIEKASTSSVFFNMGSRADKNQMKTLRETSIDHRLWYQRFFEDSYAPLFKSIWLKVITVILIVVYVVVAYFGAQRLIVGFDLLNIVHPTSPARRFLDVRAAFFPEDVTHLDVAVMNPPNMGNKTERNAFIRVLEEFEGPKCGTGRNGTDFWYFQYKNYMDRLGFGSAWDSLNQQEDVFMNNLDGFLLANEKYSYDVQRHQNRSMKAFRLSVTLQDLGIDDRIVECAHVIREICDSHPEFSLFTYTMLWNLADQFEIMWPQTMQDLYISIAVMVPISLLFIPQPLCALMISLNIASIAFGVIGFMSWWDVNLDATSMITIAMSVGFSVDFAAHVTFAYMTDKKEIEGENDAYQHLVGALGSVGWPVTQASMSVLLGISSLATVESYVVQTCFKTVFLVIVFGSVHALLFLPMVLYFIHSLYIWSSSFGRRGKVDIECNNNSNDIVKLPKDAISSD